MMLKILFLALAALLGRLQAAGGAYVELKGWPLPQGKILGYNLYVSDNPEGEFRRANAQPITGKAYVLSELSPRQRYYFKLTQLSTSQPPAESPPSKPFSMLAVAASVQPGSTESALKGLDFEDPGAFQLSYVTTLRSSKMNLELSKDFRHSGQTSLKIESSVQSGAQTTALLKGRSSEDCPFQGMHSGNLTLWIYSEKRFELGLGFREGQVHGGDGVSWVGPFLTTPGGSTWAKMVFPLGPFKRVMEERNGMEMTHFYGNGQMHLNCVVELQIHVKAGKFLFYVDDLNFE